MRGGGYRSRRRASLRAESQRPDPPARWWGRLALLGPGLAIAATGVGAGDLVAAAVSGSRFGYAVVWAALAGALLKYVLNEGLARWQLATGTTLLEGWVERLGRWVSWYFLLYLVLWSFIVGGALIAACGLAAHAIAPLLSVKAWGAVHSLVVAVLVLAGGYGVFERLVKVFVGIMFLSLVGCALWAAPPGESLARSLGEASVPAGSGPLILGVIGGVGGSLTLLSYGYWIREKGWRGQRWRGVVRQDLGTAYLLTGLFGLAVMVLASATLHEQGVTVEGSQGVLTMGTMMGTVAGTTGRWVFLLGFWGAVATSMLGVWQGVPYLFCDFVGLLRGLPAEEREALVSTRSPWYRAYLAWLALPPLLLLFLDRPVGLVVLYAVAGALFMPFLAGTLLYMNARADWVGREMRSGPLTQLLLLLCLALFAYLGARELLEALGMIG